MDYMLVLGASPNPERFSYKAVKSLIRRNYNVIAVGFRTGKIENIEIIKGKPYFGNVHTILLYLGPVRQKEFYDYIIGLHPERIIFNPGTENAELKKLCEENNIKVMFDCALVMLSSGIF